MNLLVQIMGSSRKTFPHIFDMRRVDVAINQIKMWENLGCVEKKEKVLQVINLQHFALF